MQPAAPRRPARRSGNPLRWLARLGPVQSWLVVMAVIVGLNLLGLRLLAWLVAAVWLGYAIYTWVAPTARRYLRSRSWRTPRR